MDGLTFRGVESAEEGFSNAVVDKLAMRFIVAQPNQMTRPSLIDDLNETRTIQASDLRGHLQTELSSQHRADGQ